jgi:hypothetical protein
LAISYSFRIAFRIVEDAGDSCQLPLKVQLTLRIDRSASPYQESLPHCKRSTASVRALDDLQGASPQRLREVYVAILGSHGMHLVDRVTQSHPEVMRAPVDDLSVVGQLLEK